MLIFNHYTAADVIDLDDDNGRWTPVEDDDRAPTSALVLAYRYTYPIRGSYTVENDKRYSAYWTEDDVLVLRTPDEHRYTLFRRIGERKFLNLMNGMHVVHEPATYSDGRLHLGHSTFSLRDRDGAVLEEVTYFSQRYFDAYMQDFTGVEESELSDWDFFLSVKGAIEELGAMSVAPEEAVRAATPDDALLFARSGEACGKAGFWVVADDIGVRQQMSAGTRLPQIEGRDVTWLWVE